MKASTICSTIISMAVVATAIPTADNAIEARTDKTLGDASKTCNANQVVSCCNTSSKQTNLGLIGTLLGGGVLAGNSCSGIKAGLLSGLLSSGADSVCGNSNSVKCCNGSKQEGFINVNLDLLQCSDIL